METENYSKQRIVKNSLFLYLRMFVTMWFNLWATRLVLSNLGVDDMGVFGVVGGIVSMFAVLANGVTIGVQRFLTFELGKGGSRANGVFVTSMNIILLMAVFLVVMLEVGGLWYLYTYANLPTDRITSAVWVLQFSIVASVVSMLSIPYNALVIAHERMGAFSVISLIQVLLNWGAAWSLALVATERRLTMYGVLLMLVAIVVWLLYVVYCRHHFEESRYKLKVDKAIFREIGIFTGVTTSSNILQTLSSQGLILVINTVFGVAVNAVYMIALQLKNAILSFGLNIFKAVSPQITKTYAAGDDVHFRQLVYSGSKMEVYMVLFIMLPFLFKTDYILHLWLGTVPAYTVAFTRCMVFLSVTYAMFEPIRTAVLASGHIRRFLLIPDMFYFVVTLVGAYAVGKITGSPQSMILTVVCVEIATCVLRVWYAIDACQFKVSALMRHILFPCAVVTVLGLIAAYGLSQCFADSLALFLVYLIVNSLVLLVLILLFGLSSAERAFVRKSVIGALNKRNSSR